MGISAGPDIIQDGLVFCVDAADKNSYPGSGTTWTDISGNRNNGTLTNGPTFSSTNGGAIVFDGTNDYTTFSVPSITNLINNFSVEIWYKSNNPQLWYSRYPAGGFMIGNLGGAWKLTKYLIIDIFVGTVPTDSNWHQVAYVYSSTLGSFVYVDGVLNGSSGNTQNLSAPANGVFDLGVAEYGYHNGNIASAKVYNRPLAASEILQNYNAQKSRFGLK